MRLATVTPAIFLSIAVQAVAAASPARDDVRFLHDGRARSIEEAILWHGGEAERARERFTRMDAAERAVLVDWISEL
jgi:CxxC motif-containing protein (DUF1111 family)